MVNFDKPCLHCKYNNAKRRFNCEKTIQNIKKMNKMVNIDEKIGRLDKMVKKLREEKKTLSRDITSLEQQNIKKINKKYSLGEEIKKLQEEKKTLSKDIQPLDDVFYTKTRVIINKTMENDENVKIPLKFLRQSSRKIKKKVKLCLQFDLRNKCYNFWI